MSAGDVSQQRGVEAADKLVSLLISFVAILLSFQAIGLDIQSVLAISGFGGLALGLAGREILENLFNGLLIISSRSFEVGEEIMFTQVCCFAQSLRITVQWTCSPACCRSSCVEDCGTHTHTDYRYCTVPCMCASQ